MVLERNRLSELIPWLPIDTVEHKITCKCIDTACPPFDPEYAARLRGKLVYVLDTAWVYGSSNMQVINLPDGLFVDAYTGDVDSRTP